MFLPFFYFKDSNPKNTFSLFFIFFIPFNIYSFVPLNRLTKVIKELKRVDFKWLLLKFTINFLPLFILLVFQFHSIASSNHHRIESNRRHNKKKKQNDENNILNCQNQWIHIKCCDILTIDFLHISLPIPLFSHIMRRTT